MANQASAPPLGIVTVTYNSATVLTGLLDSLSAELAGLDNFDVVVVDNDSADGSADLALAHPLGARVIRMGRNAGYAAGINAGTATFHPDAQVLILNPDLRLLPGAVRRMRDCLADPSVGVAVPCNLNDTGAIDPTLRRHPTIFTAWAEAVLGGKLASRLGVGEIVRNRKLYDRGGLVEWASGSALLVSARARRTVGEWDEVFFLYSEEVDFQRRVREAGLAIAYVPQAQVVHKGGEYRVNPHLYALLTANRIRYYGRHHGSASTALFRFGVVVGHALRASRGATHRAGLHSALCPLRPASEYRLRYSD